VTATLAPVSAFLDRPAVVGDRVRYPGSVGWPMSWIGNVVDVCTDPRDAGMVRCAVPGTNGLVRVRRSSLQVLGGAR
jgi:hypothetical protein